MPQYLKSLELQGYKTFANRTNFEFAENVTAIVGPNGSGKSNIVDSLRWVLGEQSYGLLRGKRTDDMIFSGSEHRARAGMASATVVFDNSSHFLPLDFNEVAITRRAYRDGQNEYLVNGQKVRLKDVSELLSQAGLAERTYTIVGQGLVDIALSLRAEERRRLFEEAAGIGLHRTRREEALRRLEATRRNLERVQDILAELEPRLKSLVGQLERVQKYEQVQNDLRAVLREWYGYHWHHAQAEFVRTQHYAQEQETILGEARERQNTLSRTLAGLREEIQGMRARLSAWHRQSAELHSQREQISRDLAVFAERARSFQEQRQFTIDELGRLGEDINLQRERLQQAVGEQESQRAELEDALARTEEARQTLQARQTQRQSKESEIEQARKSLDEFFTRRDRLTARLAERRAQIERQQEVLAAAGETISQAEKECLAAQKGHAEAQAQEKKAKSVLEAAETAWQTHFQKIEKAEKERLHAQDENGLLRAELARLKAQAEIVEQAEQSLTGYASGTRLIVEAGRTAQAKGVKGALIPLLDVPREYETAVAACLGEYINAVLLNGADDSDSSLDLLESKAARAALLPLAALVPPAPLDPPDDADCIGVAARLVNGPAELRPALDLLLGNVFIVKDRQAARRVLRGQPETARAVTLKGEVFFASGPILAGLAGGAGETSTISRTRQRRELSAAVSKAEKDSATAERRLQKVEKDLTELRQAGEAVTRQLNESQRQAGEAVANVQRRALAAEQTARQLTWQKEQRQRVENEIVELDRESGQMNSELASIKSASDASQETLHRHQNELAQLALDEYQAQLNHWETQTALIKRSLSETENRRQERQTAYERAIQNQSALENRLDELQRSQEELLRGEAQTRQTETDLARQIEDVQRQIKPGEQDLENAEKKHIHLLKDDEAARQNLSRAEQRNAQASIGLARAQEALQNLRTKIEDDFGIVSFDYAAQISGPTPLPIEGMVESLPVVSEISEELDETIQGYRRQLRRIGPVNPEAKREHQEVKERFEFLTGQVTDLTEAEKDIRQVILELDTLMQAEFKKTFEAVSEEFRKVFVRLFGGGSVRLMLTNPDDLTNTGVDIEARLPGRRPQGLSLLSGGERSLTATALIFALLMTSPTPFCVLDEVDAMLDEANVGRFRDLLSEVSANTQIIIITHNRNTVQAADAIYGITMDRDSTSQIISLRLDEVDGLKGVAD